MKMKFQRQVQLSLSLVVGAVLFLQTGCKQKEAPMQEAQAPSSSAQLQTPSGADTHVHEELYRMAEQPFEHDPAKRPLVLSQPAPSRREWVLQVLKQGYHDTGKTNNQW